MNLNTFPGLHPLETLGNPGKILWVAFPLRLSRREAGACGGPTCFAEESGGFLSNLTLSWDCKLLLPAAAV